MNNEFYNLSKNFSSPIDFINDKEVRDAIDKYRKTELTDNDYSNIICAMINTTSIQNKELLVDLFQTPSILTISSYKKFLRYLGQKDWEKYKNCHQEIYDDLSVRICLYLENETLEKTLNKFSNEIHLLSQITNYSKESLIQLFSSYQNSFLHHDILNLAHINSNIKSLIKEFNSKSREKFVSDYIDNHIIKIKNQFKYNIENPNSSFDKLDINQFINMVFENEKMCNSFKSFIEEKFSYVVDNNELEEIILNVLKNNNQKNIDFFGMNFSPNFPFLSTTKAFNRLNQNYLNTLNKLFTIDQIDNMNQFFECNSIQKRRNLKLQFSKSQLLLLEEIKPILNKAKAYIDIQDSHFCFSTYSKVLDNNLEKEEKKTLNTYNDYLHLHNLIYSYYYIENKSLSKILNLPTSTADLSNVPFTDDNYRLKNRNYLFNFEMLAKILMNLDNHSVSNYHLDDDDYLCLKNLLIDEGLLSCILVYNDYPELITNIINYIEFIYKDNLHHQFNMNRLRDIVKKVELYQFIDDFTLALLGEEVASKIVYNFQFLKGENTSDTIQSRLKKACDLMIRAEDIQGSAVPYFEPIQYKNITLERYHNNNPNILTSGIDSNTCFKIDATDNDYLFYSILNKNGMVAKIVEDDKMIGRFTAHRFSNALLINSVRTVDNHYKANSFEELERNDKIVEIVSRFAKKMIEITTSSDCPIDFVVSNKAGILSSFEYDHYFPIIPECFFKNPIDCYHDDFVTFKNLYTNCEEQFLDSAPFYKRGDEFPFVTDYGNYPIVLIASRDDKKLNRRFDITFNSPEAIYERPPFNTTKGTAPLENKQIQQLNKIDALYHIYHNEEVKKFHKVDYGQYPISAYEIGDDYYILVDKCNKTIYKSISKDLKNNVQHQYEDKVKILKK